MFESFDYFRYIRQICHVLLVDVSLPEVSREDLPARVQEFLRRDDEQLESQLQEQNDEQVSFATVVGLQTKIAL